MRAEKVLLCGYLAWPVRLRGNNKNRAERSGPVSIPTAARVEVVEFVLSADAQRWGSIVRYQGRTYAVPTSLLATPAEAFKSLTKKGR